LTKNVNYEHVFKASALNVIEQTPALLYSQFQ